MKVLIIDNYDSFTYNLYQYIGEILATNGKAFILDVFRNDKITLPDISQKEYDRIIISPGPGDPRDSKYFGVCTEVLKTLGETTPMLGVCLGMQGIASVFGGEIVHAKKQMHGKKSTISHDGKGVFASLPQNLEVMRYHSLIVEKNNLPDCLEITATTRPHPDPAAPVSLRSQAGSLTSFSPPLKGEGKVDDGEIMGIRHKIFPIEGIQFHPESFATEAGKRMLENFLFHNYE